MLMFLISILGLTLSVFAQFPSTWLPEEFLTSQDWVIMGVFGVLTLVSIFQWLKLTSLVDARKTIKQYESQTIQNQQTNQSLQEELARIKAELLESTHMKSQLADLQSQLDENEAALSVAQNRCAVLENQLALNKADDTDGGILTLLGSLQKKGRFLDFVQGDISQYPDAQVGAAARVVHQGCLAALQEFLKIEPIHDHKEGEMVDLRTDSQDLLYSFTGEPGDQLPRNGRLLHKGWKTRKIQLPKRSTPANPDLLVISPAEIQI